MADYPATYPRDDDEKPVILNIDSFDLNGNEPQAGIDFGTMCVSKCHSQNVITSITIDGEIHPLPRSYVSKQLHKCMKKMTPDVIKVGVLDSAETVHELTEILMKHKSIVVVLDLQCSSVTGYEKQMNAMIVALREHIIPLTTVLIGEHDHIFELLLNQPTNNLTEDAHALLQLGPQAVILRSSRTGQCCLIANDDLETLHCTFPDGSMMTAGQITTIITDLAFGLNIRTSMQKITTPALLPHMSLPPFMQDAWFYVSEIYKKIHRHPFLIKLADGSLHSSAFNFYIVQGYFYLLERGRVLTLLAERCTDDEVVAWLKRSIDGNARWVKTTFTDNEVPPEPADNARMNRACKAYTSYMLELASDATIHWLAGLVAAMPCSLVYFKVGRRMAANNAQPGVKRYQAWIDMYADEDRNTRFRRFSKTIDRLVMTTCCSLDEVQKLKEVFRKACQFEYNFWDDAYSLRC